MENEGKVIFVNKKEFRVTEDKLTGERILRLANFDANLYDLYLVQGQKYDQIAPDQSVDIRDGMSFFGTLVSGG